MQWLHVTCTHWPQAVISWGGLSNVSESQKMSSCQKYVKCQKIKYLDYGGGSQINKLTQWGSQILMSILTSHMMVTKTLKMFLESIFGQFWWTSYLMSKFMSISVNLIMFSFSLPTSCIVQMFDYLTFDIFLTTWHLLIFDRIIKPPQPAHGYFLTFDIFLTIWHLLTSWHIT